MAYRRPCRSCGKPINLRRMPGGQWVPFEGYDTPHKCDTATGRPKPNSNPTRTLRPSEEASIYQDIPFEDIEMEKAGSRPTSPTQSRIQKPTEKAINTPVTKQTSVQPDGGSIPGWIWWVGLAVVLFWLLR